MRDRTCGGIISTRRKRRTEGGSLVEREDPGLQMNEGGDFQCDFHLGVPGAEQHSWRLLDHR